MSHVSHRWLPARTCSASRCCHRGGRSRPPPGARACSLSQAHGPLHPPASLQTLGDKGGRLAAVAPRLPWWLRLLCTGREQSTMGLPGARRGAPALQRRPLVQGPRVQGPGLAGRVPPSDVSCEDPGWDWLTLQRCPQISGLREAETPSSYRPGVCTGSAPLSRSDQLVEAPPRTGPPRAQRRRVCPEGQHRVCTQHGKNQASLESAGSVPSGRGCLDPRRFRTAAAHRALRVVASARVGRCVAGPEC